MLLDQISLIAFITNNGIKTETGEPLDLKTYRFMYDVYADRSNLITCMKCAQIGFTTYQILKSAHECKNEGIDIVYVFPTDADVKTFSGGKTNKIIAQNEIFQSWTKDKDSVEQKQWGDNTIYYRGSWTNRAALSFTAKKLIIDEYDRCKQEIVEMYDSRLQSVANPKKAFFSNPSKPDFGVDIWYKKSDEKKWNITHSCGKRFIMTEECVDYKQEVYKCPHCLNEITDEERRNGEWYDKDDRKWDGKLNPKYEWSGWWIPLWIAPWMPAKKICEAKRDKTAEFFYNFVAGLPYINTNDMLSMPLLVNNLVNRVNDQTGRIVIGVDTGHNIHYTIGNKQGIFYHGYINSIAENDKSDNPITNYDPYDELDKLMVRFSNAIMVADQGGDLIGIRKLQSKYKGRVFLCWFVKETRTQQIIRWSEGDEYGKVLVDRNRAIQIIVDEIKEKRFPVWGSIEDWEPYFKHWLNIYRVKDIQGEANDPQYGWRWIWKRKGPDHLALATLYMRVGLDRFGEGMVEIVSVNNGGDFQVADRPIRIPRQYQNINL